jgi:hypothetical protein
MASVVQEQVYKGMPSAAQASDQKCISASTWTCGWCRTASYNASYKRGAKGTVPRRRMLRSRLVFRRQAALRRPQAK